MAAPVRVSFVMAAVLLSACSSPTAPTPPARAPEPAPMPALSVTCPAHVSASTPEGVPAVVSFSPPTVTGGVAPVQVSCTRESGSPFAAGTTEVQCTATDAANQTASCVFNVVVTARAPELRRTKYLAFGDSLTLGEITVPGEPSSPSGQRSYTFVVVPRASYPTVLAEALKSRYRTQAASIDVVNAGWSGEWAQDGARRLVQVLNGSRPEVVLLLEGVNDVATLLERGIAPAANAVGTMIREARGRGADVLVGTVPPSRAGGDHAVAPSLLTAYNDRLRQIAAAEGAAVVDLYTGMLDGVDGYIGVDGLHPTERGYVRMAELFLLAIRAQFEVRASPARVP